MNERIREFAEQCVGSRPYNTSWQECQDRAWWIHG